MITKVKQWQRPLIGDDDSIALSVKNILQTIQTEGDSAVEQYALEFDQRSPEIIQLKSFEEYNLAENLAEAIQVAANRIETFAKFQMQGQETRSFSDDTGNYSQVVSPIQRVGAYIPGGRFPLISTALMTLIPAKVAGCSIRIACSPSDDPAILAAASLAGATEFIQLGGVQAIGALAFGYREIEPVNIIVGPGNAWVNEAKKQIQSKVKIDGLAGPSELLAICDGEQSIEWLALDALAQAEHDPMACSLIVSDSSDWLTSMLSYLESNKQTKSLLTDKQIELVYAENKKQIIEFSENYAPEHLMLCHRDIDSNELDNYGSLFVGANSAVALGDYISGPNHTLPTLGYAKQNGGLSVNNFLRIKTVQEVNDEGRQILSKHAAKIAAAEGLDFHLQSLKVRC